MSMRLTALTVLGVALAVIAEGSALGLLGLSGWFVASCAIAGATLGSTFSYVTPSGGVRAFALTRIAANYAARIVLHRVALARLTMVRLGLFDAMSTSSDTALRPMRGGEALDRTMRDAAIASESVIRWQAPVATLVACACGVLAVMSAISPMAALALAASGLAMLLIAVSREGRYREVDDAEERARIRGELVAAIDAWPEMRSLGATATLRNRTDSLLAQQERSVGRTSRSLAATDGMLGMVAALGLATVVGLATTSGAGIPELALLALLTAGTLESATQLGTVIAARRDARLAQARLAAVTGDRPEPEPSVVGGDRRRSRPALRVRVRGYQLPPSGDGLPARRVDFEVDAGETLVVFGPTGIGKTTLLAAIADRTGANASTVASFAVAGRPSKIVLVPHDDHLFTGTVASNLRLADPAATDEELGLLLAEFELAPAGISGSTRTGVNGRALSGGEQRRIHLARAALANPDVLIVDEPATALDEQTASVVLDAIRRRLPSAAIVYATHEPLEREAAGAVRSLDLAARADSTATAME